MATILKMKDIKLDPHEYRQTPGEAVLNFEVIPAPTAFEIFGDTYSAEPDGTFVVRNRKGEFDRWCNALSLDARRLRVRSRSGDTVTIEPVPLSVGAIGIDGMRYLAGKDGTIEIPEAVVLALSAAGRYGEFESHGLRQVT